GCFLHSGTLHVALNGIALWSLGGVMERFLGWQRYLIVYLVSGLGGALASWWFHDATSTAVGASGAILGLFGSLAMINLGYWSRLPLGFRQPRNRWILILTLNAALPFIAPLFLGRVDVAGHVGGF